MYGNNLTKKIPRILKKLRSRPIVETKKPEPVRFGGDLVIESFKLDELLAAKAKGKRVCDFVYDIDSGKTDQAILKKWTDWFTFKKVPWAVTKGRIYRLWKIWEGMSDKEIKEINEGISWKKGG